ncbi:MAG: ABC transporter ATP-binding protein [Chitinophagaceae bacterium]
MSFLTVRNISKKENGIDTVNDVSFLQESLQNIAIAGETGSGKTTLVKMIGGLVQPDDGEILFEGKRIKGPLEKLIPGHPGIIYLSQHFELRNNYYVHEILSYANQLTEQTAEKLFSICRIDHLLKRKTDQLSGGEKQRIALAKLLISSPKLLLLDEPFSNLDTIHKSIIKSVLKDVQEEFKVSSIMISHDIPDVLAWADSIIVMKDGKVLQKSVPREIYHRPVNEYCAALFGEYNLVKMDNKNKRLFLRPEDIFITKNRDEAVFSALVKDVQFRGDSFFIEAVSEETLFKIRTVDETIQPGNFVYLSVNGNADWHL